jgi:hypothetical protein
MKTLLKTTTYGFLVVATCSVGYWATAQSHVQRPGTATATNFSYALEEFTSFTAYLEKEKLTNAADRFYACEGASIVSKESADIGLILHVLVDLRKGRTNDAIQLLEIELEGDAIGFAASYRELPDRIRGKVSLDVLRDAQYYSTNYGFQHSDPEVFDGVTNALKLISDAEKK